MQHGLHARKMLRQKRAGKFHRQKLVPLIGRAPGGERLLFAMVKTNSVGFKFHPPVLALDKAVPVEIQTQLHAGGMKARGPVEFAPRKKIVPLDTVTRAAENCRTAVASPCPRRATRRLR